MRTNFYLKKTTVRGLGVSAVKTRFAAVLPSPQRHSRPDPVTEDDAAEAVKYVCVTPSVL